MLLYQNPPKCHKDHFHHALRRIENFGLYKWKQNCMVHRISKSWNNMKHMKHMEEFHFNKPTCVVFYELSDFWNFGNSKIDRPKWGSPPSSPSPPTSKGCNLRRDPQHATGPMCWYWKTVAQDVRKAKESPHPVLSCDVYEPKDEKNMWIYKHFQNKCLKLSPNTPIHVKLRMSHYHLSLHHVAREILPLMTSWLVTFGSRGICTWFKETLGDRQPPPAPDMLDKMCQN